MEYKNSDRYKKIDIEDLGLKQRFIYKFSKGACLVPKLLLKMSEKLINPITKKITGGFTFNDVKAAATDITMQMQNDEANNMQSKIDEGKEILQNWQADKEYYIENLGKFKSYQATINDLENSQIKLRQAPKPIRVAKNYFKAMMAYHKQYKKEKSRINTIKQVIETYQNAKISLEMDEAELESLRNEIAKKEQEIKQKRTDFNKFVIDNQEIISQIKLEDQPKKDNTVEQIRHKSFNNVNVDNINIKNNQQPAQQTNVDNIKNNQQSTNKIKLAENEVGISRPVSNYTNQDLMGLMSELASNKIINSGVLKTDVNGNPEEYGIKLETGKKK